MSNEERLDELIAHWLRNRETGIVRPDLDALCADAPELRAEFESRIRGIESMERFMLRNGNTYDTGRTLSLNRVGAAPEGLLGYEILGQLGRGGMGVVFHARQAAPRREVALKMILADGEIPKERLARFREETQSLARIQHPNIVQIFEVGEHQGNPFFSMELLRGGSLKEKLAGRPQQLTQAAIWIEILALAIHAAHLRGVIHRDLKPGNVLFAEDGTPKLADFGLAKRSDATVAHTEYGDVLGTPAYMSPEQATGDPEAIGPATDIYALGVILYELLTGRPPFVADSNWEVIRLVRSEEPVAPHRLNPSVPPDLNTICLKCLEKEPGKRYATAEVLAQELHRFLNGEPIVARPIGRGAKLWRWCRRRPALAGSLFTVGLLALSLFIGGNVYFVDLQQEKERRRASEELAESKQQAADTATFYTILADIRDRLDEREIGWRQKNFDDLGRAAKLPPAHDKQVILRSLAVSCADGIDLRERRTLTPKIEIGRIAFFPDGSRLALADHIWHNPRIRIMDPLTGEVHRTLFSPLDPRWWAKHFVPDGFRSVAISPDGRWLVAGTRSGHVRRWDLHDDFDGPVRGDHRHDGAVVALGFSPDGSALYSIGEESRLKRWDVVDGWKQSADHSVGYPDGLQVDPLGRWVMCMSWESDPGAVSYLDPVTLKRLNPETNPLPHQFALSPDGQTTAYAGDGFIALMPPRALEPGVRWWDEPTDPTKGLKFSSCGQYLVGFGGVTGRLLIRAAAGGYRWLVVPAKDGFAVRDVACSPNGRSLVVAFEDRTVVYDLEGLRERTLAGLAPTKLQQIELSRDGQELITIPETIDRGAEPFHVQHWNLADPLPAQPVETIEYSAESGGYPMLTLSPMGDDLAFGVALGNGPETAYWRVSMGDLPNPLGNPVFNQIRFGRGGTLWAAGKKCIFRWTSPDAKLEPFLPVGIEASLNGIVFQSIDGDPELTLAGRRDGHLFLLDPLSGKSRSLVLSKRELSVIARNESGTFAAVGSQAGELMIVRLPDGTLSKRLSDAHDDLVTATRFVEDRLLISGSRDRTVKFWTPEGELILTMRLPGPVREIEVSAEGDTLAILVEGERAARIWHLDLLRTKIGSLGIDPGF